MELPPCTQTALEIVNDIRAQKRIGEETVERFATLSFAEQRGS